MKRIIQVDIRTVEVPDDYQPSESGNEDEIHVETENEIIMQWMSQKGGEFRYLSVDKFLREISSIRRFNWWARVSVLDFTYAPDFPQQLFQFMQWFYKVSETAVAMSLTILRKRIERLDEYETGVINMRKWDPDLFTQTKWQMRSKN